MATPKNTREYEGDSVLEIMSKYAPNRNQYVFELIANNFGLKEHAAKAAIMEFGAGRGEFINRFKDWQNLETFALEIDPVYFQNLNQSHHALLSLQDRPKQMDFIYAIDVLEHIEDDEQAFRDLYEALDPGGKILIYVPARMELYSPFDKSIGHFRRYHKKELGEKITAAGFQLEKLRYHELIGYFAAYYNKFFAKDGELNASAVRTYDKLIVPTTNVLEKVINPPIGKSLYALASK